MTWGFRSDAEHAAGEALDRAEREHSSNLRHYGDDPRKQHKIEESRRGLEAAQRNYERARLGR